MQRHHESTAPWASRRISSKGALVTVVAVGLLVSACAASTSAPSDTSAPAPVAPPTAAAEPEGLDFPTKDMSFILPSTPGGGVDTTARQMQPFLEEILGVNVNVLNRGGGNFSVGPTALLASRDARDCHAFQMHAPPILQASYLTQAASYNLGDFHPISGITIEPGVIRVRDDSPYATLADLVADAIARPGRITASISGPTDANYFGILDIMAATGAEFNIVPYAGGGPARNALLSGEVDFTHAGMFNSLGIDAGTRVIAVHQPLNTWPEALSYNAPTVNDALGIDTPSVQTTYGLYVTTECYEDNPERHQFLVDVVRQVQEDPRYLALLESAGEVEKVRNVPPDDYQAEDLDIEARMIATLTELGLLVGR